MQKCQNMHTSVPDNFYCDICDQRFASCKNDLFQKKTFSKKTQCYWWVEASRDFTGVKGLRTGWAEQLKRLKYGSMQKNWQYGSMQKVAINFFYLLCWEIYLWILILVFKSWHNILFIFTKCHDKSIKNVFFISQKARKEWMNEFYYNMNIITNLLFWVEP